MLTQLKILGASVPILLGKSVRIYQIKHYNISKERKKNRVVAHNTPWSFQWNCLPISRSCQGCAATDLLDKDERILSLRGGGVAEVQLEVGTLFGVSIGGDISAAWNDKNTIIIRSIILNKINNQTFSHLVGLASRIKRQHNALSCTIFLAKFINL